MEKPTVIEQTAKRCGLIRLVGYVMMLETIVLGIVGVGYALWLDGADPAPRWTGILLVVNGLAGLLVTNAGRGLAWWYATPSSST